MRVFLIHGMGRSRASMRLLGARLRRLGHDPSSFGYSVARDPLAAIAEKLALHVRAAAPPPGADGYAIVGHSLGNVIARLATPRLPEGLQRIVMLAPPNRAPVMARALAHNPLFRALARDAGQRLADPSFFDDLPRPSAPTLIFAGTGGPRVRWLPHGEAPSDGVLTVEETRLDGADHREVRCIHTFIMNDWAVTREIARFLGHEREALHAGQWNR